MGDVKVDEEAGELLETVDRVRSGTRTRVRAAWFPLFVFGLITLSTIPLVPAPVRLSPR